MRRATSEGILARCLVVYLHLSRWTSSALDRPVQPQAMFADVWM